MKPATLYRLVIFFMTGGMMINGGMVVSVNGQNTTKEEQECVVVDEIKVEGNKKTRRSIIIRELDFRVGDTLCLPVLVHRFKNNENQLLNSGLFNSVDIEIHRWTGNRVMVNVKVKERWYTFPVPVFALADRNFNVWWVEYDHNFSRTVYGIKFYQENLRGRNEELKVTGLLGFEQRFELRYKIPFIDDPLEKGVQFLLHYSRNKEIPYNTRSDKLRYYKNPDDFLRRSFFSKVTFTQRKAIHNKHYFGLSYHKNRIADTIADLNERYFLQGRQRQQYFKVNFKWERDYRNFKPYPTTGSYLEIQMGKIGLGIFDDVNLYNVVGKYSNYWRLSERNFAAARIQGKFSFPTSQPYFNQQGLGYEKNMVRGYEYYVIDGQQYGLFKSSYKFQLFDLQLKNLSFVPLKQFKTLPLGLYLKIYGDFGYVRDDFYHKYNNSRLANRFLAGGGAGLDLVTFYDIVLRLEYTFNRLQEHGFFLHFESAL